MALTPVSFTPFTGSIGPLTRVSPFTHRDNATYLRVLAELVQFINSTLRDETNAELQRIIDEFQKALDLSNAKYQNTAEQWEALWAQFMSDVTAALMPLNDQAMANLIDDALSKTAIALGKRYGFTPKQFGAVLDGVADDSDAMQAFFTALATNGGIGSASGIARITKGIAIPSTAKPFSFSGGQGKDNFKVVADFTVQGNVFNASMVKQITLRNFAIDSVGTAAVMHGIAFVNSQDCIVSDVEIRNWIGTALIFYYSDTLAGASKNNHFLRCVAYGNNIGNNGFMFGQNTGSTMRDCWVYDLQRDGNPSYGLQLKNGCDSCTITGGGVDGAKAGVAFGYDGASTHSNNHVSGVSVRNCQSGFLGSNMVSNSISMTVDMMNDIYCLYGIALQGNANYNTVHANIRRPADASTVLRIQDDYNTVYLDNVDALPTNTILALLLDTSVLNQVIVGIVGGKSPTAMASSKITDQGTNNKLRYNVHASELHSMVSGGNSIQRFTSPDNIQAWIQYNHNLSTFTYRNNGVDTFHVGPSGIYPAIDVTEYNGTSSKRWLEVWTKDGVILNSPNGTKYRIKVSDAGAVTAVAI